MAREKIIERIRKLLALAGNNPNEAEAALAMEKAQAELALHNLSMSEIDAKERDDIVQMEGPITPAHPHLRQLANAVANLYFAGYFYIRIRGVWKSQHVFVGSMANVQVALLMFDYLAATVDRLALAGARANGEGKAYVTSFRVACTSRLAKRIHDRIEEAKKGGVQTASGTTLPALLDLYTSTQKQLQAVFEEKGVVTTKARTPKINSARGMLDGRAAGDTISLDRQVGKQQPAGMLE